jgi:hypothetical protein
MRGELLRNQPVAKDVFIKGKFSEGVLEGNFTGLFLNIIFGMVTSINTFTERT